MRKDETEAAETARWFGRGGVGEAAGEREEKPERGTPRSTQRAGCNLGQPKLLKALLSRGFTNNVRIGAQIIFQGEHVGGLSPGRFQ